MALDRTGKPLALRGARHIDEIAGSKYVNADGVTDVIFRSISKTHLADEAHRRDSRLGEVTFQRLRNPLLLDFAEADLDGVVAVVLHGLVHDDNIVT